MARGKGGASAAAKAAAGAPTRISAPGAMAAAAGLLEDARKEAESLTALEVASLPRIPLSQLAPHPLNPEHRHMAEEELRELALDIERRGVLVPVLVASRDKVIAYDGDLAAQIPDSALVVLQDGHRRWGAALLAGVTDIPYLLREDLADPAIAAEVFLSSNIHHKKLTPIEEAQGYRRLQRYRGVKQSELGSLVGVSQSRVSKTLKLLELPSQIQTAVNAGHVSPHAARELLSVPTHLRETTYKTALESLNGSADLDRTARMGDAIRASVNATKKAVAEAEAAKNARAMLVGQGIEEINPEATFGSEEWRHLLRENEVEEVRAAGELAGAVVQDTGRVVYYSEPPAPRYRDAKASTPITEVDADAPDGNIPMEYEGRQAAGERATGEGEGEPPDSNGIRERGESHTAVTKDPAPTVPTEPAAAAIEIALRAGEEAHLARLEAIRRVVSDHSQTTALEVLSDAVLASEWIDFETGHQLAIMLGFDSAPSEVEKLFQKGRRVDLQRASLTAALAALEAEAARSTYSTGGVWPEVIQRHVRRLADLGHYTLADYDKDRLDTH